MSNENCGFPGIWMAFTHLVWMLAGSAGVNTQSAAARVGDSETAANMIEGIAQYASSLERADIDVPPYFGSSLFRLRHFDVAPLRSSALTLCRKHVGVKQTYGTGATMPF